MSGSSSILFPFFRRLLLLQFQQHLERYTGSDTRKRTAGRLVFALALFQFASPILFAFGLLSRYCSLAWLVALPLARLRLPRRCCSISYATTLNQKQPQLPYLISILFTQQSGLRTAVFVITVTITIAAAMVGTTIWSRSRIFVSCASN